MGNTQPSLPPTEQVFDLMIIILIDFHKIVGIENFNGLYYYAVDKRFLLNAKKHKRVGRYEERI